MTTRPWKLAHSISIPLDRPALLAILNVTPDSFSDGGELTTPAAAAEYAERAIRDGASVLDIGGESTRPGASRVSANEQIRRIVPAIEAIRARGIEAPISVDTTLAPVAEAALQAGANAVNDVAAGLEDARLLGVVAAHHAGIVLMHRLRAPGADQYSDQYADAPDYPRGVTAEVGGFLAARVAAAAEAGIDEEGIVIDPGLGFGKTVEQNLALIRETSHLVATGLPVLSALSRKSFTARAAGLGADTPPKSRVHASVALSVCHLAAGAKLFRVHDVAAHRDALAAAWSAMRHE